MDVPATVLDVPAASRERSGQGLDPRAGTPPQGRPAPKTGGRPTQELDRYLDGHVPEVSSRPMASRRSVPRFALRPVGGRGTADGVAVRCPLVCYLHSARLLLVLLVSFSLFLLGLICEVQVSRGCPRFRTCQHEHVRQCLVWRPRGGRWVFNSPSPYARIPLLMLANGLQRDCPVSKFQLRPLREYRSGWSC